MTLRTSFTPLGDVTNINSMSNPGIPFKAEINGSFFNASNDFAGNALHPLCPQRSGHQIPTREGSIFHEHNNKENSSQFIRWGNTASFCSQPQTSVRRQNDPYNWKWSAEEPVSCSMSQQRISVSPPNAFANQDTPKPSRVPTPKLLAPFCSFVEPFSATLNSIPPSPAPELCRALVQFKCHQAEFSSGIALQRGQYVVVQGDRGVDIGVVARINTSEKKQYVEKHGPSGHVMRHANQREVDYWATALRQDEASALSCVQLRVLRMGLPMEVKHAEYQFDKKKLTFYYDAKTRVDFVPLLKDLFREFNCRIWMEKVRVHE